MFKVILATLFTVSQAHAASPIVGGSEGPTFIAPEILKEVAEPSSPGTGFQKVWVSSVDGKMYRKTSAGAVIELGDSTSLQGFAVSDETPEANQILTWNNTASEWEPRAPAPSIGLPVSSTNNGVVLWDGTDGDTIKDSSVTIASGVVTATEFYGPLTGNVTGNVSGSSGSTTGNAATATALAANPSGCPANQFANDSAANGDLTCAQPAFTDIGGVATIAQGGTNNGSLGVTPGGVLYTDGSKVMNVGAGTLGQVLLSNGSSAPSWGAAGVGGTNEQREYISNGKAESSTTGWSTYADAAASTPADGTGGSPNVVLSRTTTGSEIIRETASFKLAKDAADRQGEGVSYDFTVDPHDYANGMPVYVSFEYKTTAAYASSDIVCSVYDKDAAALLTLFDSAGLNGALPTSTGGTKFTGRFYPSTSTSDDYRLICHIATTNASAWDFIWDSVHAGTANLIPGAIITPWTSYTPTLNSLTSVSTIEAYWRRVGDSIEISAIIAYSGAGNASNFTMSLPSGLTMDSAKITSSFATTKGLGTFMWFDNGTGWRTGNVVANTSSTISGAVDSATSVYQTNSTANGDYLFVKFTSPITNWAASASLSTAEALFSTVKVRYTTNTSNSMASGTTRVDFEDKDYDEFSAVTTGASWVFTAPKTGLYKVNTHNILASSAAWNAGEILYATLYKNGNASATLGYTMVEANGTLAKSVRGSASVLLNAGDTVDVRLTQSSGSAINLDGSAQNNYIEIEEDPRFNIFSTYGPFEVLTATSSTKTPGATNNYHQLTGNSLTLTAGTWKLTANGDFSSSGGSAAYASMGLAFYGANGADSSSAPTTALSAVTGLTVLSVQQAQNNAFLTIAGDSRLNTSPVIVRCAASSCVVYAVSYATMTTAANSRVIVYANAERLQ